MVVRPKHSDYAVAEVELETRGSYTGELDWVGQARVSIQRGGLVHKGMVKIAVKHPFWVDTGRYLSPKCCQRGKVLDCSKGEGK